MIFEMRYSELMVRWELGASAEPAAKEGNTYARSRRACCRGMISLQEHVEEGGREKEEGRRRKGERRKGAGWKQRIEWREKGRLAGARSHGARCRRSRHGSAIARRRYATDGTATAQPQFRAVSKGKAGSHVRSATGIQARKHIAR